MMAGGTDGGGRRRCFVRDSRGWFRHGRLVPQHAGDDDGGRAMKTGDNEEGMEQS